MDQRLLALADVINSAAPGLCHTSERLLRFILVRVNILVYQYFSFYDVFCHFPTIFVNKMLGLVVSFDYLAGAQAVLKYTLKTIPGSPLPPGKKLLPYIRLTKNYERTWHRAMRKVKIVNMLRRMGKERLRRRESEESLGRVQSSVCSSQ